MICQRDARELGCFTNRYGYRKVPFARSRRGGICVCHLIERTDVVRSWSEFPMRLRVESDKNTSMFAIIEMIVAPRTEISVRSLLSGETGLI
jgi:hypothetical protein